MILYVPAYLVIYAEFTANGFGYCGNVLNGIMPTSSYDKVNAINDFLLLEVLWGLTILSWKSGCGTVIVSWTNNMIIYRLLNGLNNVGSEMFCVFIARQLIYETLLAEYIHTYILLLLFNTKVVIP